MHLTSLELYRLLVFVYTCLDVNRVSIGICSSQTYNVDRMTADSAGTATAFLCGVKTRYGAIGVNQNVKRGDCSTMPGDAVDSVLVDSKKGT